MSIYNAFNNARTIIEDGNNSALSNQSNFYRTDTRSEGFESNDNQTAAKNSLGIVDNLIARGGGANSSVGKAIRMAYNNAQGVIPGAGPRRDSVSNVEFRAAPG